MEKRRKTCKGYYCPCANLAANDLMALLPPEIEIVTPAEATELLGRADIRLLWENPCDSVPGVDFSSLEKAGLRRTVVNTDLFGASLPQYSILNQHDFSFRICRNPGEALLVAAVVAGYCHMPYSMPEECHPLLFVHPQNSHCLISTTALANFSAARFAPRDSWRLVIQWLIGFLLGKDSFALKDFPEHCVRPRFAATASVDMKQEQLTALNDCGKWFASTVLLTERDGLEYVQEGFSSNIFPDGRQDIAPTLRGDCNGEAALVYATSGALFPQMKAEMFAHARRTLTSLYRGPLLCNHDPKSATYGSTYFSSERHAYYGDDNARGAFGAMLYTELSGDLQFIPEIMRQILSVYRTTSRSGLRRCSFEEEEVAGKDWHDLFNEDYRDCRPHYQATTWALNLQAYAMTGMQDFLDKAKSAIHIAMEDFFPDFPWTNGITQEWGRLLLPLAMLVEIEDTPQSRQWLDHAVQKIISRMVPCGAIQEAMGTPGKGLYPAPSSNDDYGRAEASVIQDNGNPVCDLLYTMPYAFAGMNEAAIATGNQQYAEIADRMAAFLMRIQSSSVIHPEIHGCWLRGFDFDRWEYLGNSADPFWGAWCIESGWTNAWIGATLGLRQLKRPLLCLKHRQQYAEAFQLLRPEMIG